jgi:hypothetical protein
MTKQNKESSCLKNHNKDSICLVIYQNPDQEISPNTLSSSETIVTVSLRTYTVRFIIVPRTVRFDTELYDIVPSVFDADMPYIAVVRDTV